MSLFVVIASLAIGLVMWMFPLPEHNGIVTVLWSKDVIAIFEILILIIWGRSYSFSKKGLNLYVMGILVRRISWENVRQLTLICDKTRVTDPQQYLVVEIGERAFSHQNKIIFQSVLKKVLRIIRVPLRTSNWQAQMNNIEQFRKIDAIYTCNRRK